MTKSTLTEQWSPELAKTVEAWLTTILSSIEGVENAHGCSYDQYQDFKVTFRCRNGTELSASCFLGFYPRGIRHIRNDGHPALHGWGDWSSNVVARLKQLLPMSDYTTLKAGLTWHYWLHVSEDDLKSIAEKLAQ